MLLSKEYAWWNLRKSWKSELQAERLAGHFGGENAAAAGRAPYFWSQEYGNPAAAIKPQGFAQASWKAFQNRKKQNLRQSVRVVMVD